MPIRSRKNQYRGVNAHLHSYFQTQGDWQMFHTAHINDLARVLSSTLPNSYYVRLEKSIQIREIHPDTGEVIVFRKRPDILIYGSDAGLQAPSLAIEPSIELTVDETFLLDEAAYLSTITIYQIQSEQLIAQIELLSPANKPLGSGYEQYIGKREIILRAGIVLVEIDYLHETDSPIEGIPSYPDHQPQGYPYTITISDPRPNPRQGKTRIYGFHVDDPIPSLPIPLAEEDHVQMDFALAYQQTFEAFPIFADRVDYEQFPINFHRYAPIDQERIKQRMKAVQIAHANGVNLDENAPLPLEVT